MIRHLGAVMDHATVDGATLGRSLRGVGLNILTRDAGALARFVAEVFDLKLLRASPDFALVGHGPHLLQFHADGTFAGHPLLNLLPENPPRGVGIQIYLFDTDPDAAATRAPAFGGTVIEPPRDKPHGLRETTILAPEGQSFTAAKAVP